MTERTFVRFHEYNDHEGERWNWWLQYDGNEAQIDRFCWKLNGSDTEAEEVGYDFPYSIHADYESESVVDKLVEYAEQGYFDAHNKVTGKFTCPDDLGDYAEHLYKGGIRDHFKEQA